MKTQFLCRAGLLRLLIVGIALLGLGLLAVPNRAHAQTEPVRPAASDPVWQAQFWNNVSLSGLPALTRNDADLNFRWGNGSPGTGIANDGFSARWTRTVYFPTDGVYRFTLLSDDGSRLFIDDQLVIDAWYDHEARTFVVDRNLAAGHHLLRVEYYDNVGTAQVQLSWAANGAQTPASTDWRGEYFNNRDLLGTPALTRQDKAVDFNWGQESPQAGVVNDDNFSARWSRTLTLPSGVYRFRATVDDGVRVYVNNRLVIDQWREGPAATYESAALSLSGRTALRIEYFDATDLAQIQLVYMRTDAAPPTPTANAWKGEYYNNTGLSGDPALVRNDANLDFQWRLASPAPGTVNADDFSVRWTRTLIFLPGAYRFKLTVDDGARLWVNNTLVIDQWRQGAQADFTGDVTLPGGALPVRLEYVEYKENAIVKLTWSLVGGNAGGGDSSDNGNASGGENAGELRPVKPTTKWVGEYFNNPDLSGNPVFARDDSAIDFDWAYGSPRADLPADNFSVRWTNTLRLNEGLYRFTTETDDGVRLWVDDRLLIDEWRLQAATPYSTDIKLSKGQHTVRMEYQERGEYALARLTIYATVQATSAVGNLVTCVPPQPANYAWIRLYRLDGNNQWVATGRGTGSINPTGYLKLDGLPVDEERFGSTGEPYRVEQWIDGRVVRSTGNFQAGEPEFRIRANADTATPWTCSR